MGDLLLATVALTGLSLVALVAGMRISSRWPERKTAALTGVVLAALLLFVFRYHGTWQIARVLPFSGAIVLGNWIPLGGAFLAGITLGQRNSARWRRSGLASLILLASGYSVACCFLGQLPSHHDSAGHPAGSKQTRRSSCGACCAAMLLKHRGIEASEEELLGLCLTSYRGSPALGLYRGLKLKTAGTLWDVQVVTCSVDELLQREGPLLLRDLVPAVSVVGEKVRGESATDGIVNLRTSRRRFEHAVLLMGVEDNDHLQIFDPAMWEDSPIIIWSIEDLRERWQGEALRLVRRPER